jgi:hypothetical protein
MTFSFLPSIQNREGGGTEQAAGRGRRRSCAQRRSGDGEKWREGRGDSTPLPTLGCDGVQRWIGGGGRREVVPAMGGGAGELKRESKVVAKVRGGAGNVADPFIAAVWR